MRACFRPRRAALRDGLAATAGASAQSPRAGAACPDCRGGRHRRLASCGSTTNLGCVLRSGIASGTLCRAAITAVGLDIGITEQVGLAWAVFAPTPRIGRGDLSGAYAGASGRATVGVGGLAPTCWSAARPTPSRCSRSPCRARSAWNLATGV